MSRRPNAPYADQVKEEGRVLIYEGHDEPRRTGGPDPKSVDQPEYNPGGTLTENGRFAAAARRFKCNGGEPELVRVYEKIKSGIWSYNGVFKLVDVWKETSGRRRVFKFRLELVADPTAARVEAPQDLDHTRLIPSEVKVAVWQRDKGRCVKCGSEDNLHLDHDIPFSKGGSSLTAANIKLLCARHNLAKSDRIE